MHHSGKEGGEVESGKNWPNLIWDCTKDVVFSLVQSNTTLCLLPVIPLRLLLPLNDACSAVLFPSSHHLIRVVRKLPDDDKEEDGGRRGLANVTATLEPPTHSALSPFSHGN